MKRMSEVFELPVSSGNRGYCTDAVFQAGGNGEWCSTFYTDEQAKHAINHVDALANALEMMLDEYCRVTVPNKVAFDASMVLAAYRGDITNEYINN